MAMLPEELLRTDITRFPKGTRYIPVEAIDPNLGIVTTRDLPPIGADELDGVCKPDFYTEVDAEHEWILERAGDLGLPGIPRNLSTSCGCACDDCIENHVGKQLREAAEEYRIDQLSDDAHLDIRNEAAHEVSK